MDRGFFVNTPPMHTRHYKFIEEQFDLEAIQFKDEGSKSFAKVLVSGYCFMRMIEFAQFINIKTGVPVGSIIELHNEFMDSVDGVGKYDFSKNRINDV